MFFGRSKADEETIRRFRNDLAKSKAAVGKKEVRLALEGEEADVVLVNKHVKDEQSIREILKDAKSSGVRIIVLDQKSPEGALLHSCNDIAAVLKMPAKEKEHITKLEESELIGDFINKLDQGKAVSGLPDVLKAVEGNEASLVCVLDSAYAERKLRDCCDKAERFGVPVKVFRAEDLPGIELKDIGGIICFKEPLRGKRMALNRRASLLAMEELITETGKGNVAKHPSGVAAALSEKNAKKIFVTDAVKGSKKIKKIIGDAKRRKVKVLVFSARDELGVQLAKNGSIVCITKAKVTGTGRRVKR